MEQLKQTLCPVTKEMVIATRNKKLAISRIREKMTKKGVKFQSDCLNARIGRINRKVK